MSDSSSVECDVQCNLDDPVHTIVTISSDDPTLGVLPRDRAEDNIEMVYIRDVLLAQHPFLPEVENAVGRLTDSENADLLNAEALSGLIDPDQILLEALRALSDDPSMRKLQASLEVETNMINLETAAYQTVQTTPFSLMNITECTTDTKSCTTESPKTTKSRKKFTSSSRSSSRVMKKREKTPPESQKLLKDWLFAHSRHPYPTDSEKEQLCMNTGLSLQQLNNWFINARRRILPSYIQEQQKKTKSLETTNSQLLYTSHRLQI